MIQALYQDDEVLVIDKPAGLASQPGEGVRVSVVEAVERDFGFKPYLVHRLDKETSGCLVVARSSRAAASWASLVESRELRKTYRALVSGRPEGVSGVFEDAVRSRGIEKAASTSWSLVGFFAGYSYLELVLGTGRTHQIRLHLASHGLPILGDDRHGDFPLNKRLRKECGLKRLLLVAWSLDLPNGRKVRASIPEHFADFLSRFPDAPKADAPGPDWARGSVGDALLARPLPPGRSPK